MHRPRTDGTDGGAKRHNKRVRTPHNTRETQRQKAIGHGETLMPNNVIYRTPNSVIDDDTASYMSGQYQNRPNSIELRRSYQSEGADGYVATSPTHQQSQYATAHHHQQQQQQHQQSMYDDGMYNSQNLYAGTAGQGPLSNESLYSPSRTKIRPTQPPPAPPSTGNTPTGSSANTPTRSRSISAGRDALPPPPPVPLETMSPPMTAHQMHQMTNGNASVAAKLLARSHSTSRSGSPQLNSNTNAPVDPNALVMAQLNSQINSLNNLNMQMAQQMNALNDLPPPPPIPEQVNVPKSHTRVELETLNNIFSFILQHSPKQQTSPKSVAPPPPPPPPPLNDQSPSNTYKPLVNGNLNNGSAGGKLITPAKLTQAKKILPSSVHDDTRNDLLKAIRDGNYFCSHHQLNHMLIRKRFFFAGIKLRKVEKIEQKEKERSTAFHDVASILARRVALELSGSEDSDSDEDSECWVEPNETTA